VKKLVGLLGWLGVALVVAAVGLRFFARPDWLAWSGQWSQYLAIAGLVVTVLYGLSQWRDIGRSMQGRGTKYGSIAVGSVLVFLGILVGINWIASRENKRWDLTSEGQFGLSDQTKKILTELKKPVAIKVYYTAQGGATLESLRDKIGEYQYHSRQLTADYVDAVKEPMRAREDKIEAVPTLIIQYDGRTERTSSADESAVANALKKVIEGKAKKVYFVQGHGEHDSTQSDAKGYSRFADALKTDNFEVATLTLAQEGKVPDDATAVVVAGPKFDYLAPEIEALRVYLKKAGKVFLMVDPGEKSDSPPLTNLVAFAKEWGVDLGNNIVIDQTGYGQLVGTGAATPIAMPSETFHAITRDLDKVMTGFPVARSATPVPGGANGRTAQSLLQTAPQSWAETDLKELYAGGARPALNPDKGDLPGPVMMAAAVSASAPDAPEPAAPELPKSETRVVIVGDSDFLTNNFLNRIPGNQDFGLNIANWLAQQENLISIRPKDPENRPLTMTATQRGFTFWLTLVIIPVLLIGNGIRVWWRSR
jgi:ABC-type uncharacterized transport system involved in gliding motility auxiliary subunit